MKLYLLAFAASACAMPGDAPSEIGVAPNDLGVSSLQIAQYTRGGEPIFEVRGFDGNGAEIATLSRRIGFVAELAPFDGTELLLAATGETSRIYTKNLALETLELSDLPSPVDRFLRLPEVATVLDREARLRYAPPVASDEVGYQTLSCPPSYMRPTPIAGQCCWTDATSGTTHEKQSTHTIYTRAGNSHGWVCKTSTGGSCTGTGCFYGPCGFAAAVAHTNGTLLPHVLTFGANGNCGYSWYTTPPAPEFADVTGTCPYSTCENSRPKSGGPGSGYWDY